MPDKDTIKQEKKGEEKNEETKEKKSTTKTKKRATTREVTKPKSKKDDSKTTQKSTRSNTKKSTTKKTATKEMVKKATKPTKKDDTKSKKATKKTASKDVKKETPKKEATKPINIGIYGRWISEAIFNLQTEEKQYVSYAKIKQYLLDYMDQGLYSVLPKRAKKTLESLKEKKLLKARKESYTFTSKGLKMIAPDKKTKRKKVVRPEKKPKKVVEPVEFEREEVVTSFGRVSRPTPTSE